ncbi:hypothetical protein V6N11_051900 [Hibiscus sabdariffa]|uniref:Reverse transcriptase zinc-binding domain-containing protein n=1 Tax=Hibiscus sabdariffa TaxID=183260 RepID=A0ABR2U975_9ROSI
MGGGKFLSFWTDIWACEMPLQMKFPRILALAVKKTVWPLLGSKLEFDQMWMLLPFATVWSIWLHRNEIVFQGKKIDVVHLLHVIKLRVAWWFKAKVLESQSPLDFIISDPSIAC